MLIFELNWLNIKFKEIWQNAPTWLQNSIPQLNDVGQHIFVKQVIADLLVHNDVDWIGNRKYAAMTIDEFNILDSKLFSQVLGLLNERRMIERIYSLRLA